MVYIKIIFNNELYKEFIKILLTYYIMKEKFSKEYFREKGKKSLDKGREGWYNIELCHGESRRQEEKD